MVRKYDSKNIIEIPEEDKYTSSLILILAIVWCITSVILFGLAILTATFLTR